MFPACAATRKPGIITGLANPMSASLYHWYAHGELSAEGSSITEGIGQSGVTADLEGAPVDKAYQIPDAEAPEVIFDLLRHTGLSLRGSSGINVAGALRLARELGRGHTIVTVLADGGQRHANRLFNPDFLSSKGLPPPDWLQGAPATGLSTPLF